jgi:hypothetical protein
MGPGLNRHYLIGLVCVVGHFFAFGASFVALTTSPSSASFHSSAILSQFALSGAVRVQRPLAAIVGVLTVSLEEFTSSPSAPALQAGGRLHFSSFFGGHRGFLQVKRSVIGTS